MKPFYGWRVLGAATVGLALGYSNIGMVSFGLFILPLSAAFGWGRGDISVAMLLMNCAIIVMAPIAGVLIDRVGVRRVLLPSIVLFSLAVGALSFLDGDISTFYLTYTFVTILGIGTIPATYTRVVIAWFDRKRGLAIGIAMAGIGIGAALIPLALQYIIASYGWRAGYSALAGLVLFVSLPVVTLFLRERPDDLGQAADGVAVSPEQASIQAAGFEFSACLRQRSFWLMAAGFPLLGLFTSAVIAHLVPLLQDRNVSPGLAALGASLLGVSLIAGRIVCGGLMDRFFAPRVVIAFLLGPIVGLGMLASGASGAVAFGAVLLIGLGIGAELDFMSYLVSRYLGPRAYGRTYGSMYAAFAVGAGIGSIFMGYVQQRTGTYDAALWTLCLTTLLSLLPFGLLGPYPALPAPGVSSKPVPLGVSQTSSNGVTYRHSSVHRPDTEQRT